MVRDLATSEKMRRRKGRTTPAATRVVETLESRLLMTAANLAVDPGNSTDSAYNAGTLSATPAVFSDFVGTNDTDDFYKFSVASSAKVQLNLNGMSDDADLILLDSNGNQLNASDNVGTTPDTITRFLDSGTYFADVTALKTAGSTYTLSLTASALGSGDSGHTPNTATDLGSIGGSTVTINGSVTPLYTDNYYKFTLAAGHTITVAGTGPTATTAITFEDGSGNILSTPTLLNTFDMVRAFTPGTYYFHVQSQAAVTASYRFTLAFSAPPAPDQGGDSPDVATPLGTLSSTLVVKDQVSDNDPSDYYAFTVPVAQTVTLTLTGLSGDADLGLLGADGTFWGASMNSGTTSENVKLSLPAGTYDAGVVLASSGTANYTLTIIPSVISSTHPDNAGNTTGTARDMGVLSGTQSFSDYVGPDDTNDYYKFTLNNKSNVAINLGSLVANADVQLLNSSGGVITTSSKTGTTADAISSTLDVGTYYVRVYPVSGAATTYTLSLTGTIYDGAGNTLAAALNIGTLSGSKTYKDFVGTADSDDYYKFTLAARSTVAATLSGLQDEADLALLDSSGNLIANSTNPGASGQAVSQLLNPGTYYVHVISASAATNYVLTLTSTIFDGAGNTLAAANDLGVFNGTATFFDWVGTTDTNDYYKFTFPGKTDLTINLGQLSANADIQLLTAGGTVIGSSNSTGTTGETLVKSLDPGLYYLRVYPVGSVNTPYKLVLTAPLHDGGGSTMATAGNLGMLSGAKSFNDSVSSSDTLDYYQFVAPIDTNYTFSLTGANGGAHLALLTSNGTQIANATSFNQQLTAGQTYYAVVSANSAFAAYTLNLNGPSPVSVGTLWGARSFGGSVSTQNPSNFYSITLATASAVSFRLTGLAQDADVRVFDANGKQLARATFQSDDSSGALAPSLAAGSYYVVVSSTLSTGYTLNMVGPTLTDDFVAGAKSVGTLTGTALTYNDSLFGADVNDYYRFTLTGTRTVGLTLNGLSADANIQLISSDGTTVLATSANSGITADSISKSLAAGTYYIRVYRTVTTGTNYALKITS